MHISLNDKTFERNCISDSHLLFSATHVHVLFIFIWRLVNTYTHTKPQQHKFNVHHFSSFAKPCTHCVMWQFHGKMQYCYLFWFASIFLIWRMQATVESSSLLHEWTQCTQLQHFCRFKCAEKSATSCSFGILWYVSGIGMQALLKIWEKKTTNKTEKGARVRTTKKHMTKT